MGLQAARALLSVIVPPCCGVCRAAVEDGAPLCGACRAALRPLPPGCPACALPGHRARGCPAAGLAFDAAWAAFAHEGAARSLVLGLKAGGRLSMAGPMAEALLPGAAWAARGACAPAVLIPVPAAARRRRRRGFDPVALLAARLGEAAGLPVADVLRRRDASPRQAGSGRRDRRAHGRVRVDATGGAPPLSLLVDDVHTTGATLDACAAALKSAGARRVVAVTFARAL